MKAIAVFCVVAMFCGVLAKSKKDDNKPIAHTHGTCLPCERERSTRATFKRIFTKKWKPMPSPTYKKKPKKVNSSKKKQFNTTKSQKTTKTQKTHKTENTQNTHISEKTQKPQKTGEPYKTQNTEKLKNTQKTEKTQKPYKTEKTQKSQKVEKTQKANRTERAHHTQKTKKTQKPPKTEKAQKTQKIQKPQKTHKTPTTKILRTLGNGTKVKVAVYYEALCPDSKAFIVQQLAPVWRDFRGVIKVKLVPYGKATHDKIDGKWQFNCHHGADECYGNKIQSCILKSRSFQDTEKMELVICLMSQTNPDKSLDTCLSQIKRTEVSSDIKSCASGDQGDSLLASYGDKTDNVSKPLSFVPTVIINEKFDQKIQDEAFTNLKSVVCRVAPNKPSVC